MRVIFVYVLLLAASLGVLHAQSDLVFFSERGEKFYVVLNGLKYNDVAQTNVRVENLNGEYFKAKVIFEDKNLGEVNGNVMLEKYKETTYVVKYIANKNKVGAYSIRYYSSAERKIPAPQNSEPMAKNQEQPQYQSPPPTTETRINVPPPNPTGTENVNVDVNVNTPAGGFGISVRTNGMDAPPPPSGHNHNHNNNPAPNPVYVPGYSGRVGCPMPMNPTTFSQAKTTISKNSFEDTKLTIAKQVIKSNCLTANQVKEICELFTFEGSKLDFAKYAYPLTYDVENYFVVNQVFTFESSIEELANHINSVGR